ncbi:hypothetical protein LINPERHAP2_LOCUS28619 [Linum perenne]
MFPNSLRVRFSLNSLQFLYVIGCWSNCGMCTYLCS